LGEDAYRSFCRKRDQIEKWRSALENAYFPPDERVNGWLSGRGLSVLKDRVSAAIFLRRPEVNWESLVELGLAGGGEVEAEVREQLEIQVKYEGYIKRDLEILEGMRKHEETRIPAGLDFGGVSGLSNEVKNRLSKTRPETLGQMSRMPGVTPAAVANLLIHLKMGAHRSASP
jgi:tRNA uridine 5-carboxymethylaminomethyl modification enzyme